ncbi:MAG: phage head closure protein [Brevundimonas sp.]
MPLTPAGDFDRRILIQQAQQSRDEAGDVINEDWIDRFKLWARRVPGAPGVEISSTGGVLRQRDITFAVRDRTKAQEIAPETYRILYKGRIYEIVGIVPGKERANEIEILTASRPDKRGSRGDEGVSGGV